MSKANKPKQNTSKWTKITIRLNEYDLRLLHAYATVPGQECPPNAEIVFRLVSNAIRK